MKKIKRIWLPMLLVVALVAALTAVTNLEEGKQTQDLHQLEKVLHKTAVACYAVEGIYPPNVEYMCQHYGLTFDESRYLVHYELAGSNFMPEITVMERTP